MFGSAAFGRGIVICLGLFALYSFIANMVTWTLSANRSAAEAARLGDLPIFFGRMHARFKTPVSSAVCCGVIASLVVLTYGAIATTAEELFWTTFAFSSVIFLLPYLLLFLAFLKLRRIRDQQASAAKDGVTITTRGYRVPGNFALAVSISVVCMLFIVQAIVLFVFKPGAFNANYALAVIIGVLITLAVGELLVRIGRSQASTRQAQN
jgi:glutamate:GABA antiporter